MADTTAGIGHVAMIARDDVDVDVGDCLARRCTGVEADVVAIGFWVEFQVKNVLGLFDNGHECGLFLIGCVEPCFHDPAGGDEDMAGRDREAIEDGEGQGIRAQPVANRDGEEWGLEWVHDMKITGQLSSLITWHFRCLHHCQQLSGAADGHEPGEVVVVGGEVVVCLHADEDDGFRVEAFGLVDGGVADASWGVGVFRAFAEVAAGEGAAVAERGFGEGGLGMEDEDVGRVAEAGFLPAGEDGFDEVAAGGAVRIGAKRVDFRVRAFGEVVAVAEGLDHRLSDGAGVVAEELPEGSGVTDRRLESDMRRLRPSGGKGVGVEAVGGAEGRALGGVIEDAGGCPPAFLEQGLVDVPPARGRVGGGCDVRVPCGVVVLSFIDHEGVEPRPGFPECGIARDCQDLAGHVVFVEGAYGVGAAAGGRKSDGGSREGAKFQEEFFPAAHDDASLVDFAQGDEPAELGGECLVVGEKQDRFAFVADSMAEGELQGVPGLAGACAASDQELAVVRELVEEGEARGELALEELLGVIDKGLFLLGQRALAEGGQHGPLLCWGDRVADVLSEDAQPGVEPVLEVVAGDEPVSRDALEGIDGGWGAAARDAEGFFDEGAVALVFDAGDHSFPFAQQLIDRGLAMGTLPMAGFREMPRQGGFHLQHEQPASGAEDKEIALARGSPGILVVVAPDHRPWMRGICQGAQPLRHPDFGGMTAVRRAVEDPVDHGWGWGGTWASPWIGPEWGTGTIWGEYGGLAAFGNAGTTPEPAQMTGRADGRHFLNGFKNSQD